MKIPLPDEIAQSDSDESEGNSVVSKSVADKSSGRIYPRIPHLPGSQMAAGDHRAEPWQIRVCCEQLRDSKDWVVVQEKLDGSCMAVAKMRGEIIPLARSGNRAAVSRYAQHRLFHKWVYENLERFDGLLNEDESCFGEWLIEAHGTRYDLPHEPFVAFDLKSAGEFLTCGALKKRAACFGFVTPRIFHKGKPLAIEGALKLMKHSGHGAIDPVEGAVWRVERNNQLNFFAKYVRSGKRIGCYLPERPGQRPIWNWRPSENV